VLDDRQQLRHRLPSCGRRGLWQRQCTNCTVYSTLCQLLHAVNTLITVAGELATYWQCLFSFLLSCSLHDTELLEWTSELIPLQTVRYRT